MENKQEELEIKLKKIDQMVEEKKISKEVARQLREEILKRLICLYHESII